MNVTPRRSTFSRADPRVILIVASGIMLAILLFVPPLTAWPVSDAWYLFERAQLQTPLDVVTPTSGFWYRPVPDGVMWLWWRIFGMDPVPYRLVALAFHLVVSTLTGAIVLRLTGVRWAALLAGVTLLFDPHAHEPLWEIANLHTVVGATVISAAVLAYLTRMPWAIGVAILAVFVDEAGVLVAPLVTLAALTVGPRRRMVGAFWFVAGAYVVFRVATAGVFNETQPCRDASCMAAGAAEWLTRLLVRPDRLLAHILDNRIAFTLAGIALLVVAAAALRPWRRPVAFAAGWIAVTVAFYIVSLYPYISDRHTYLPDVGVALLIGTVAAGFTWQRAEILAAATIGGWLVLGIPMLATRGAAWIGAGEEAREIIAATMRAQPNPPTGYVFAVRAADTHHPGIQPGNTGAYVFHNGIGAAIRLLYQRGDLSAVPIR
jgi:hypothetical protein